MLKKTRRRNTDTAELNITSFMNLMIVLVPVLLLNMVFSHITVLNLKLPANVIEQIESEEEPKILELIVRKNGFDVYYPQNQLVKKIANNEAGYDYNQLSETLIEVKAILKQQAIEKKDIQLLFESGVDYQTIVSVIDTARSYEAVVATSVVNAELFPDVSLGDAPIELKPGEK